MQLSDVTAIPPLTQTSKSRFLWCCGLFKFTRGAIGPFLLSSQRQIFSSLRLRDLCLWFGASHPDSPRNLFTATFLNFSLQPSCFPEREHDVSIGLSNTEGDTNWYVFLNLSGYSSCSQNCLPSLLEFVSNARAQCIRIISMDFHTHRLLTSDISTRDTWVELKR